MGTISDYELQRRLNIERNKALFQDLGLDATLKDIRKQKEQEKKRKRGPTKPPPSVVRRSSRIQGLEAEVTYAESELTKIDYAHAVYDSDEDEREHVKERKKRPRRVSVDYEMLGPRFREEYDPSYLERLGTCTTPYPDVWADKILDKVNGSTCHQCRQKTIDKKTRCSKCADYNGHGQFCGRCLQIRYGENLLEVIENENWVCPMCRDICNCSICRNRKGWGATGILYTMVERDGRYPSVAHYLINEHLKRTDSNDENSSKKDESEVSAKWRRKSEGDSANTEVLERPVIKTNTNKRRTKKVNEQEEIKVTADVTEENKEMMDVADKEENTVKAEEGEQSQPSSTKSGVVIQGGSTYVSFDKIKEENEKRRKELDERRKRRKSVDIDVEDESFSDKPKRKKGKGKFELTIGTNVACRAPEDVDEYFWIAKVVEEPSTVKRQKVKVQWYDGSGLDERTYLETQLTDYIPITSIFYGGFDLVRIKRLNRVLYVLGEDLEPYDLSDEE